jgi:hypothetical protein
MATQGASSSGATSSTTTPTPLTDILAVAVAGIFQVSVTRGQPNSWNVMTGCILLCILYSHKITSDTRDVEILALATSWALTLILTFGVVAYWLFPVPEGPPEQKPAVYWLFPRFFPVPEGPAVERAVDPAVDPAVGRAVERAVERAVGRAMEPEEEEFPPKYHFYAWIVLTIVAGGLMASRRSRLKRAEEASKPAAAPASTV